jgi:hypothetical protein
MCVSLVLLTNSTSFDVLFDPFFHIGPPIAILDGPVHHCCCRMSDCWMIVVIFKDSELDYARNDSEMSIFLPLSIVLLPAMFVLELFKFFLVILL